MSGIERSAEETSHRDRLKLTGDEANVLNLLARLPQEARVQHWPEIDSRLSLHPEARDIANVIMGLEAKTAPDARVREYAAGLLTSCGLPEEATKILSKDNV